MKGLKELVEAALGEFAPPTPPPVQVSGEATRALSYLMRRWSGWDDSVLRFGVPEASPFGQTDHNKREFVVNTNALVLNPNRVLLTVTPFRLKQEAVLTGVMLHEAGHARHSLWRPRTTEVATTFAHGDNGTHVGEPVSDQTMKFAVLMEEPRVEGHIARQAEEIEAQGLAWTMRAATAALAPFTELSSDPDQQIMDIINSYVLRAGKQIGVAQWTDHTLPSWVGEFNKFVHTCIKNHMMNENNQTEDRAEMSAAKVLQWLTLMILSSDDFGTYMVDMAREVLDMLYPNGSSAAPQQGGCQMGAGAAAGGPESGDQQSDEGQDGEGNSDPSDPGEGDEPGAGVSGNPDDGGDESEDGKSPAQSEAESKVQEALQKIEAAAKDKTVSDASDTSKKIDEQGGLTGGKGEPGYVDTLGYRTPTKAEREVKKGAESFLRSLIEPTEASKILLTDQPSSSIDPARYAAWRADGGQRDPAFFRRSKRTVQPSPPVDIAILTDVSSSMNILQEPTALLSWALSSACTDLRNFAGRGTQIRCVLIHWGDDSQVIQHAGDRVPGIKEYECRQGTSAMHTAMADTEAEMPGFFDVQAVPTNRLLVHFTDWQLHGVPTDLIDYTGRALEAGVNILSVVPQGYSPRRSKLPDVLTAVAATRRPQRGRTELLKYNQGMPQQVWHAATELLNGKSTASAAGF